LLVAFGLFDGVCPSCFSDGSSPNGGRFGVGPWPIGLETMLASSSLARELGGLMDGQAPLVRALASEVADAALDPDARGRVAHYLNAFPGTLLGVITDLTGTTIVGMQIGQRRVQDSRWHSYADRAWLHEIRKAQPWDRSSSLGASLVGLPCLGSAHRPTVRQSASASASSEWTSSTSSTRCKRVTEAAPGLATVVVDELGRVIATTPAQARRPRSPTSARWALTAPRRGTIPSGGSGSDTRPGKCVEARWRRS